LAGEGVCQDEPKNHCSRVFTEQQLRRKSLIGPHTGSLRKYLEFYGDEEKSNTLNKKWFYVKTPENNKRSSST